MKKVFYALAVSALFLQTTIAQELLVKNEVLATKVTAKDNLNKSVYDYSAVEEIRAHILEDKDLSANLSLNSPVPEMKVAVKVDSKGYITNVDIVEGGAGEHAFYLRKSLEKLNQVTPVKIEGINVSQKVLIPVLFK